LLGYLGYAYYMEDNFTSAEQYFLHIVRIDSNNINANQYLARIHAEKDLESAIMFTRRLIILQPQKATHYRNLGELFKRSNQWDSSLLYCNRAYVMSPADYKNIASLADVLIAKKNFVKADSILQIGLCVDSLNIPLLKLSVRSAYEAKNYKNAIIPGERLIKGNEVLLTALNQLVLCYYNLNMYADCIRVCEYMIQNNLDAEAVYYYQARACAKLKNYTKSNELLQQCLDRAISETAELYYYHLGQNYESLKQYNKAVAQYDTAYYLFKDPKMIYYSGNVYDINLKNEGMAAKYYNRYLLIAKPESAEEKKAVEYVRSKLDKNKKSVEAK